MSFKTEQEEFWAGNFGNEYVKRNQSTNLIASNIVLFSKALQKTSGVKSCIEFGSNIGLNLKALKILFPEQNQYAVEINSDAVNELATFLPKENIFHQSILNFDVNLTVDLSLIKGVLIHIDPEYLPQVYEQLYRCSNKYIMLCEYFNPSPVTIRYRGHENKLFKRDFCGELLDKYPNLTLVDYGFAYHRDPSFPQDNANWFLLEKSIR